MHEKGHSDLLNICIPMICCVVLWFSLCPREISERQCSFIPQSKMMTNAVCCQQWLLVFGPFKYAEILDLKMSLNMFSTG